MKFHFIKLSFLLLLSSLTTLAQTQSNIADKTEEYYKILSSAFEKRKTFPHREVDEQVIEVKDVFLTITKKTLLEFVPPDKERRVETTVYTFSDKYRIVDPIKFPLDERKETITIGNLEFVKNGTGKWEKFERAEKKSWKKTWKKRQRTIIKSLFWARKILPEKSSTFTNTLKLMKSPH